jgi:hypothetical protein
MLQRAAQHVRNLDAVRAVTGVLGLVIRLSGTRGWVMKVLMDSLFYSHFYCLCM